MPMDLLDGIAQKVLNQAFEFDDQLYGVYEDRIYGFEKMLNNEYHAERREAL